MSANRSKNTGPEMEIRTALFRKGFRYRLHSKILPGKPDIVLPAWRVVVFVHGCYWHGHACRRKPHSKSNPSFWDRKIQQNKMRDMEAIDRLLHENWRILVAWECAIRRRSPAFSESEDLVKAVDWIKGNGSLAILSENGFCECS